MDTELGNWIRWIRDDLQAIRTLLERQLERQGEEYERMYAHGRYATGANPEAPPHGRLEPLGTGWPQRPVCSYQTALLRCTRPAGHETAVGHHLVEKQPPNESAPQPGSPAACPTCPPGWPEHVARMKEPFFHYPGDPRMLPPCPFSNYKLAKEG